MKIYARGSAVHAFIDTRNYAHKYTQPEIDIPIEERTHSVRSAIEIFSGIRTIHIRGVVFGLPLIYTFIQYHLRWRCYK